MAWEVQVELWVELPVLIGLFLQVPRDWMVTGFCWIYPSGIFVNRW